MSRLTLRDHLPDCPRIQLWDGSDDVPCTCGARDRTVAPAPSQQRPTLAVLERGAEEPPRQNRELHRTLPSNLRASGAANACEGALSVIFGHAFDAASIAALEAEERAAKDDYARGWNAALVAAAQLACPVGHEGERERREVAEEILKQAKSETVAAKAVGTLDVPLPSR